MLKISCVLVLAYCRSKKDAILSKIIKVLMFIFLKVSVFYDVKNLLIFKKTIGISLVP